MTTNPNWLPSPDSVRSAVRTANVMHGVDFQNPDAVGDETLVDVVTGKPIPRPAPPEPPVDDS
jgi:hypothetical protein